MTKQRIILLGLTIALITFSCNKIKDATNQEIDITPTGVEVTLPPIPVTNQVATLGDVNANIDLNALIKEKVPSFSIENLKSVKLSSLTAQIIEGADNDNSFVNLENLSIEVSATGKNSQLMASFNNTTTTGIQQSIAIPTNGSLELKELLTGANIKYQLKGKLRKATSKNLKIRLTATYQIVVGL